MLSRSWADCTSADLSVLSVAQFSLLQSFHSGCGSGLLLAIAATGEGGLAGKWSGFPWIPICVVRSEGPGSAPSVLCHPVQTHSAQCLST